MITLEKLREILIETIQKDYKHKHYNHVVNYAKWCKSIVTGKGQEEMIVSYKTRETEDQKKQRIQIYNSRTKYVSGKIIQTFAKVERADNVIDNIHYQDKSELQDAKIAALRNRLDDFYGGASLESYLFATHKRLNFTDPNAWLISEFKVIDPLMDLPTVYPLELSSEGAIDFKKENGVTLYVTGCWAIDCTETKENQKNTKKGKKYTIYAKDWAILMMTCNMVNDTPVPLEGYAIVKIEKAKDSVEYYYYKEYNHKLPYCPAIQIGYVPDNNTNGETYASPLDPASELYNDIINTKSEYDLSKALHGFLQKIQYAHRCEYTDQNKGEKCVNGTLISGTTCPSCKGTGLDIHKTVQDILLIRKPEHMEEHIPLDQMIHYVQIPQYIIDMQRDELESLEKKVATAIFNTNVFDRSEVAITATEKRIDLDSVYDVLSEYAAKYSRLWEFFVKVYAEHLQIAKGLIVHHDFPSSFHLETITELLEMRKQAIDSSAPYHIVQRIDMAISMKQNQDDSENVMFNIAREKFRPWREKSKEEKMYLLANLPKTDKNVLLYINFEQIFEDIKNDTSGPAFYELTYQAQKEKVMQMIEPYMAEVKAIEEANRAFAFNMVDEEEEEETE